MTTPRKAGAPAKVDAASAPAERRAIAAEADANLRRLVHELEVHEIELEMQNDELRQSRAEREEALTRYTELYDFAPVGYLTLTANDCIAAINLTGATLLGMDRSTLLQHRFAAFVASGDQDRWAHFLAKVQGRDVQESVELTMHRGDGSVFSAQLECVRHGLGHARIGSSEQSPATEPIDLTGSAPPPATETPDVPEVRIALSDITERKGIERKLSEAMAAAEKASRAKTDFLSRMSHELRTPLNAILGFAQLIESGTPAPTAAQQNRLEQILKGGWYLLELINDILDLAQIESDKVSLSREPVSVAEVMAECRAMIEPQAQQRDIRLSFPQVASDCFVNADRTRVKQVLINLLVNAVKYNRPQGEVTVTCAWCTSGTIRISVSDTGLGLTQEQQAQLFEPFNRLGREVGAEEGTGIGLVVTKRLVELMGGCIGVESIANLGSTFWFELGVANVPMLTVADAVRVTDITLTAAGSTAVTPATPQRTVLYVEDNPANRDLIEQVLACRPDLRLLCACDGQLGVKMARNDKPDVIIMDINLPGISGLDALRILVADPGTAHIPVIALSANAIPRDIEAGLNAGFFHYLTKPIKVAAFLEALDVALQFSATCARTMKPR